MELIMLLGEQVMDKLHFNPLCLQSSNYLYDLQQELIDRNKYMLGLLKEEPQFAIDHVPSKMNFTKKDITAG